MCSEHPEELPAEWIKPDSELKEDFRKGYVQRKEMRKEYLVQQAAKEQKAKEREEAKKKQREEKAAAAAAQKEKGGDSAKTDGGVEDGSSKKGGKKSSGKAGKKSSGKYSVVADDHPWSLPELYGPRPVMEEETGKGGDRQAVKEEL